MSVYETYPKTLTTGTPTLYTTSASVESMFLVREIFPYQASMAASEALWGGSECPYCGNRSRERDRRWNCIACGGHR
jgi:hypothetical protein